MDYQPLPHVTDVQLAMKDGAPILHDDLATESLAGQGAEPRKPTNVAKHFQFKLGEPAKGFAAAAVVVERSFTTATVHQGYIEPHNASALWNPDGSVTFAGVGKKFRIWEPERFRAELAEATEKVRALKKQLGSRMAADGPHGARE